MTEPILVSEAQSKLQVMYIVKILPPPQKRKLLPCPGWDASRLPSQVNPSPTFGWVNITVLHSILQGY